MKKTAKPLFALVIITMAFFKLSFSQCSAVSPNAVYVSPNGSGTGTAASPTNLVSAINIYRGNNSRTPIILQEGDYYVSQTLNLPSGITIKGGFSNSSGTWTRNPAAQTNVNVYNGSYQYNTVVDLGDTFKVASLIGIKLDAVHDVSLSDFNLSVGSAYSSYLWETRDGGSISAIYATGSDNVKLLNMTISTSSAENGGMGARGVDGNDADAYSGGPALSGFPASKGGNGGSPGPLQEDGPCQHLNCLNRGCELGPIPYGGTGGSTAGAAGGTGGHAGQNCAISCYLTQYQNYSNDSAALEELLSGGFPNIVPASQEGTPGLNGHHGQTGAHSTQPGIRREGREFYIPGTGGKGGPGGGGSGGGGGGAGGITVIDPAASAVTSVDNLTPSAVAKLTLLGIVNVAKIGRASCRER